MNQARVFCYKVKFFMLAAILAALSACTIPTTPTLNPEAPAPITPPVSIAAEAVEPPIPTELGDTSVNEAYERWDELVKQAQDKYGYEVDREDVRITPYHDHIVLGSDDEWVDLFGNSVSGYDAVYKKAKSPKVLLTHYDSLSGGRAENHEEALALFEALLNKID